MNNSGQLEFAGTVGEIIYTNEESGYTVLRLEVDGGNIMTVTGCIPFAAVGERLTVGGRWVNHASYGQQFQAGYARRELPQGTEAIYEYLASRAIRGIGPSTASLLVSTFGDQTLEVLEREPEKVAALRGFSRRKAREISKSMKRQMNLRRLMEFLNAHRLRPEYAMRLYQIYGDKALETLRENPYILCAQRIGADFAEADQLAIDLGMEGDAPERIAAAVLFELRHNSGNGHVFIPWDKLVLATGQLLGIAADTVAEGAQILLDDGEVVVEEVAGCQACYLTELYVAETDAAQRIRTLAAGRMKNRMDTAALLEQLEQKQGILYSPQQRKTLEIGLAYQMLLITGGPGTGKTTTVRALIAMYEALELKVLLAAPTGRAAKRMTELTGKEASTIHRLLEAGYEEDSFDLVFMRNESNPLKCDAMIVDECSMLDIQLTQALLAALPKHCRLVLVGDADQLPSVGPGNVFLDILRSGLVPVIRLTEIFRQRLDSRIVRYAHQINAGEHPNFLENRGDFYFLRRFRPETAVDLTVQLCAERLPKNMGIEPEEIQVLTPTRLGPAGVQNLNIALQSALNPPSKEKSEKKYGERIFRVGDRVMQIRNNYDIVWESGIQSGAGVFNGDIGYIVSIDSGTDTLTVDYEGKQTVYNFDMLMELEHAWAMTVHKAQGSEYRAVILCTCGVPQQLQYRSVLYTAVTRARELLIVVGDDRVVDRMIDNQKQTRRYSGLRARLETTE